MQFQFDSLAAFLHMAGHGAYVWPCYLITWASLIYLCLVPQLRRKSLLLQLKRQQRLEKQGPSRQPKPGHL